MNRIASIFKWIVLFAVGSACVDPIAFDSPPPRDMIVVDGSITDEPGPYYVKLSRGLGLDTDSTHKAPVSKATISLYEDGNMVGGLIESRSGEYSTTGSFRGRVGHSYHITIELPDGSSFESEPEIMLPAGEVTGIRYEYEARTSVKSFGGVAADVFNVFIDSDANQEGDEESYVRWRFTGTYKVQTYPQFHATFLQTSAYMTPRPCSGYVVEPALGGGKLVQGTDEHGVPLPCICCTCWIKQYETTPRLSDTELVTNGQFRNLKVGEVPINANTFFEKFQIKVDQMSMSKTAFEYFKIIRTQKEGASDIFQPPPGRLIGNIKSSNSGSEVIGLFWATAISSSISYIERKQVPYTLTPMDVVAEACNEFFPNSTANKPANWND